MLWAEHVARNTARVRDDVFDEVRRHFDEAELVELTGVCGLFAQSNRFQDSLLLPIEEQGEVNKIGLSVRVDTDRLKAYVERIVATWPREFPAPESSAAPAAGARARTAPQAAAPPSRQCRITLPDSAAQNDAGWFLRAAGRLLGGASNAVRLWAHIPQLGKLFLPFHVAFVYEGVGSRLPSTLKALVLVRTSHVNGAPHSLAHRSALGRAAGLAEEQLERVAADDCAASPKFSARERAALAWAAEVGCNTAKDRDDIYQQLRGNFSDAEIVELTGLCAVSCKVDRIQNALRIPLESDAEIAALYPTARLDPARLKSYLMDIVANWPREFPEPV